MIFSYNIDSVLGSRSKVSILRLLCSGRVMTGRQIALELKSSVWACHRSLRELASYGILELINTGRSHLYKMNRESHLAGKILIPLFESERMALSDYLNEALETVTPHVLSVILFGSIARGDETTFSGVDLLIVVSSQDKKETVKNLCSKKRLPLLMKFGNLMVPYLLTADELKDKMDRQDPLIRKIKSEGKLIFGKELDASPHPS